jgi:2-polyprenyl-3-methyl-5-hydroxy-6-metoxy-1,4-benzoquinol methylase
VNTQNVGRFAFLERAARWLKVGLNRGAAPDSLLQSAQTWEAQYAAGKWDFLAELSELARFSVLAGYICHLKPGGSVLDTGCGQGVLLRRLPSSCYSKYVGIDLSESAISVAQQNANERSTFLAADCEEYLPTQQFDVIVFNEVLCCLRDPLRTVDRYARALNPGGVLLVSLCTAGRGAGKVLSGLKQAYATVDEVRVDHSGRKVSWVCTALRTEARSGQF